MPGSRIPANAIALALLTVGTGVALMVTSATLRASVDPSFDPAKHVQLNAGGIVVTWVSADDEDGVVEWALSADDLANRAGAFSIATDVRGGLDSRSNRKTHRVAITGLAAGSTIHFNLISGGQADPNGPYEVKIPSTRLSAVPVGISGAVTFEDGSPGRECNVYIRVGRMFRGTSLDSLWTNVMTDGGSYAADVNNMRSEADPDLAYTYSPDSQDAAITVSAQCGPGLEGAITRTTADADKLLVAGRVSEYRDMDVVVSKVVARSTLSIDDVSVVEDAGEALVEIRLDPVSDQRVTVEYRTSDQTAEAPNDYWETMGRETIPAGADSTRISIPVVDDGTAEGDESFVVTISSPTGPAVISSESSSATVTIVDNDSAGSPAAAATPTIAAVATPTPDTGQAVPPAPSVTSTPSVTPTSVAAQRSVAQVTATPMPGRPVSGTPTPGPSPTETPTAARREEAALTPTSAATVAPTATLPAAAPGTAATATAETTGAQAAAALPTARPAAPETLAAITPRPTATPRPAPSGASCLPFKDAPVASGAFNLLMLLVPVGMIRGYRRLRRRASARRKARRGG